MTTIFVTGSDGFIAQHLIRKLLENSGNKVLGITRRKGLTPESASKSEDQFVPVYCRVDNQASVVSLFDAFKPDVIFHLAAEQGKTLRSFHNNVNSTINLLEYCSTKTKFVLASSSVVFGDYKGCKQGEYIMEDARQIPTNLYGAGKATQEILVRTYQTKVKAIIVRYPAVVGPGMTHGLLPDIIKKLKDKSEKLELWGENPGSRKPYTHVQELVHTIMKIDEGDLVGEFNISPEDSISVLRVAEIVMKVLGITKEIAWVPNQVPGDNLLVRMHTKHRNMLPGMTSEEAIEVAAQEINNPYILPA